MPADRLHKTRTLWLTGLLHAFTHLYQVALMPLYLLLAHDFGFKSVGQATLLVTVMMAATSLPSYPIGALADRMNRKHLLTFGLALNGLAFASLAFAPNLAWALVCVIVAGFGGSFYHPAATAMIVRLFSGSPGKALGLAGIGASVGFFIGPIYAGWRAAALEPIFGAAAWRRPVLELGIFGILAAALFAWLAPAERGHAQQRSREDRSPESGGIQSGALADRKLGNPDRRVSSITALWIFFAGYCLAFSLRDFAGAGLGSLSSLFLQNARGYDPKWTGICLSFIFLPSAISNPLFGRLSDGGRKRWIVSVLLVAAVMMMVFPRVPDPLALPVLTTWGFFFMSSYPMTEAALMESVPDAVRGRTFGLFVMTGGFLGNLSHWVMGAKVRSMGTAASTPSAYYGVYMILGLLVCASLLGLLCLRAIQVRRAENDDASERPPDSRKFPARESRE